MAHLRCSVRTLMIAVPVVGIVLGLLLQKAVILRTESRCSANLAAIGVALHQFHGKYGRLPPAYIADGAGRPIHSWRVLLLEFLDPALFRQYDFDEPWDGPHNRELSPRMPAVYACPNQDGPGLASYAAVVGPLTAFAEGRSTRLADITDGWGNTLLVAEVGHAPIPWMEPRDLRVGGMCFRVNSPTCPCVSGDHKGRANLLFANNTTQFVRPTIVRPVFEALTTISVGDVMCGCQ